MSERRPWVVASVLLLLGAAAAAGAVREHWLPCRGSMLSGSVLHGYAYGADFSDACLQAMDDGFAVVWPAGAPQWGLEALLGTAAALLLALAWTVVLLSSTWSRQTRLLAALPAVAAAAAGGASLLRGGETLDSVYFWLLVGVDLLAVGALVAVGVREEPGPRVLLQSGLVLAALGAVGWFPLYADYAVMSTFSDASWDTPPGTGYPTVVAVALLAVALLVVTLGRRPSAPAQAQAASSNARAAVSALP